MSSFFDSDSLSERVGEAMLDAFSDSSVRLSDPPMIQPADPFLDAAGEELRRRSLVFSSPDGRLMCARPDLTIPICLRHLEAVRSGRDPTLATRYRCRGRVARREDDDPSLASWESMQADCESFADSDSVAADSDVLTAAVDGIERGFAVLGVSAPPLRATLGDLNLLDALLRSLNAPDALKRRIRRRMKRIRSADDVLKAPADDLNDVDFPDDSDSPDSSDSSAALESRLARLGIPLVGSRPLEDVAERLRDRRLVADALRDEKRTDILRRMLSVDSPPRSLEADLDDVARRLNDVADESLFRLAAERCLERLRRVAAPLNGRADIRFRGTFSPPLDYYDGFVFRVDALASQGDVALAGGGRYDRLATDLGATQPISACGAAIRVERVVALAQAKP